MSAPVPERLRLPAARFFVGVLLLVGVAFALGRARTRIAAYAPPDAALGALALDVLDASARGLPVPRSSVAARAYRPPGPIVVIAWLSHTPVGRIVEDGPLLESVARAGRRFGASDDILAFLAEGSLRFSIEVGLGEGPFAASPIEPFTVVPLVEGLHARVGEQDAYVTPLELLAEDAYVGAIPTPTPDFAIGMDVAGLVAKLAEALGRSEASLRAHGSLARVRFARISRSPYPTVARVDERSLEAASRDAGDFLLRFQEESGRYTYLVDMRTGQMRNDGWNITRHAGTAYFMAQLARITGRADARASALSAIRFLRQRFLRTCGEVGTVCIAEGPRTDVGPASLLAVACAEVLRGGPDPEIERLLRGLTSFLRAQQRPDGELMHVYDLTTRTPIDVQLPYFSGEAALALVMAYDVLRDARDLAVARRLLRGIVATWDFPFDVYYFGEEHWTCIATSEGRHFFRDPVLTDFCARWLEYSDRMQYRAGETPWPIEGTYGTGPLFVPHLTPVGSRGEAFVATYLLLRDQGEDTTRARAHVERALAALLRYRFAPGPAEVMGDPASSRGGMPGSPSTTLVRNDFVQHAGSAWLRYLEALRDERAHRRTTDRAPNSTPPPSTR